MQATKATPAEITAHQAKRRIAMPMLRRLPAVFLTKFLRRIVVAIAYAQEQREKAAEARRLARIEINPNWEPVK